MANKPIKTLLYDYCPLITGRGLAELAGAPIEEAYFGRCDALENIDHLAAIPQLRKLFRRINSATIAQGRIEEKDLFGVRKLACAFIDASLLAPS